MIEDKVETDEYTIEWDPHIQDYKRMPKRKEADAPYWLEKRKCECGVATLGYETGHSDWCPLGNK